QKFIYYLLPGNFSEVSLILIATIVGFLPPLTPIMILFINLVTSDIPALGLCLEEPDKTIMRQKPRNPKEGILNSYILLKISQVVPIIVLGTIALYMWELSVKQADVLTAQTVAFVTLIFFELFHVFNAKSFNNTIFSKDTLSNKSLFIGYATSVIVTMIVLYFEPARKIFGTVALTFEQWIPVLVVAFSVIFFVEIQKVIINSEIKEHESLDIHPTRR
ncbi:MAG: cation-translocating P-type ATPase, partial [Nanoarchaeota archaeon]|nr:cation-translocating P-type ATPase [Nanoarchaeota archaeon]MBU1854078.1 cation-translocating P-type ATPase [Nanoarchaeota archaeon]